MRRWWGWVLMVGLIRPAAAQEANLPYAELEFVAHVPNARRLASDAQGALYVVTGREVIKLDTSGAVQNVLGGSDADLGAFDEVVDIDPGEGLIWVVADAGQGRLMRFSRTLMHLESLPVPRADEVGFGLPSREEPRSEVAPVAGRPVAVTVTPSGEVFAIEEDAQAVIKWDVSRRLERRIGHFGDAAGRLVEPVSLASDESYLYVADRGLERVQVYDLFGGFVRAYPADAALVCVLPDGHDLVLVHADRIRVYSREGEFTHEIGLATALPVLSAAMSTGHIFLLSDDTIWRLNGPKIP
ncbi:MAG: hypothetical protein OXM02_00730 [Bacteroidota bacterium]|nr:hypothetical protein [Bacteroidota bacterium]